MSKCGAYPAGVSGLYPENVRSVVKNQSFTQRAFIGVFMMNYRERLGQGHDLKTYVFYKTESRRQLFVRRWFHGDLLAAKAFIFHGELDSKNTFFEVYA